MQNDESEQQRGSNHELTSIDCTDRARGGWCTAAARSCFRRSSSASRPPAPSPAHCCERTDKREQTEQTDCAPETGIELAKCSTANRQSQAFQRLQGQRVVAEERERVDRDQAHAEKRLPQRHPSCDKHKKVSLSLSIRFITQNSEFLNHIETLERENGQAGANGSTLKPVHVDILILERDFLVNARERLQFRVINSELSLR